MDQANILKQMSGIKRMEQAFLMSEFVLDLARQNIQKNLGKNASKKDIQKEFQKRLYSRNSDL